MINIYTLTEYYRGYDIIIKLLWDPDRPLMMPSRWFCGYVRIPEDHKFYGKDVNELENLLTVHGGVTFAGALDGMDGFYVGFDCAHLGDMPDEQDEAYTLYECKRLVNQLIEAA